MLGVTAALSRWAGPGLGVWGAGEGTGGSSSMILSEVREGQGRDRQRGIHAEGAWDAGGIGDVKPLVERTLVRLARVEDAAELIHSAVRGALAHRTAVERVGEGDRARARQLGKRREEGVAEGALL
jgi:hypothetical protein